MTKILWAEDYEDLTESLGEILRLRGFSVDLLPKGMQLGEAIALSTSGIPDVILLDIKLDGWSLDGFGLLELHGRSEYAAIPVIVFSGYILSDYKEKALALGAKQYLLKPMTVKALTEEIQAVLALPLLAG
jgi:CheY-like chemotaxis protein